MHLYSSFMYCNCKALRHFFSHLLILWFDNFSLFYFGLIPVIFIIWEIWILKLELNEKKEKYIPQSDESKKHISNGTNLCYLKE